MTLRCRSTFLTLLFCLPFLGLCVANTAWGASDDEDEEWHDTKGPGSARSDSDSKKSDDKKSDDKKSNDDPDKKASKSDSEEPGTSESGSSEKRTEGSKKGKADAPHSDANLSFAVLGSYGVPTPQGPGIGLRGGYHLTSGLPLYIGGIGEFFFGTQSVVKNFGEKSTRTNRFMYFAAEGGVTVDLVTDIAIRPYVGLGFGLNKDETCSDSDGCTGGTKLHLTITPGIVGLYKIDSFFFGPDLRYIIVPGGGLASGFAISATAGLSL